MFSVGQILKQEREKKGLSLTQVEKALRVREKFLRAIEDNDWTQFSSKVYIAGIITNYAKYLHLDPKKMGAFFRRDYERREDLRFKRKVQSKYLTPETRKYALVGVVILFLLFFAYFAYQVRLYMTPPRVTILAPHESTFYNTDKIKIVAQTEKEASITVRGERVYPDKDGKFEYELPLKQGNNQFVAEIIGANGKKTIFKKNFVKGVGTF